MPAITSTVTITKAPHVWRSLYSNEWTSDHKARQGSIDFIGMKDYGSSIGLPDQMQILPNEWIPLTRVRQLWLFDVLCLAGYNKLPVDMTKAEKTVAIGDWAKLMKGGVCFNNGAGWGDGYADFIQGLNISALPMEWEPLLCAGNVVDVTGEPVNISNGYLKLGVKSLPHYPIRTLDATKPLPDPRSFLQDPAICHRATTIKPDGTHGDFPQFNGNVVYPLWSLKPNYVWSKLIA